MQQHGRHHPGRSMNGILRGAGSAPDTTYWCERTDPFGSCVLCGLSEPMLRKQTPTALVYAPEGMYHPSDSQAYDKVMPKAQFDAIVRTIRDLLREYPSIRWIKGHKEVPGAVTACPGDNFPLKEIIRAVQHGTVVEEVCNMKKR